MTKREDAERSFHIASEALTALQNRDCVLVLRFNERADIDGGHRDWDSVEIRKPNGKQQLEQLIRDEWHRRKEVARKAIQEAARDLDAYAKTFEKKEPK